MKKKFILGTKLHEFLMELFEKEQLEEQDYAFTYVDMPNNEVETSFSQIVDESEEPDLLCLYYLPKKYYDELRKKVNMVDVIENGFDEEIPCIEDHDLAHRLSSRGKFVFIKDLTVYESLRRFRRLGIFKVVGTWLMDYFSFILRRKPVSITWQPIR